MMGVGICIFIGGHGMGMGSRPDSRGKRSAPNLVLNRKVETKAASGSLTCGALHGTHLFGIIWTSIAPKCSKNRIAMINVGVFMFLKCCQIKNSRESDGKLRALLFITKTTKRNQKDRLYDFRFVNIFLVTAAYLFFMADFSDMYEISCH